MTKVKEESEKAGLKLNIEKTKIMASGPITSRQIDGENVETVSDFIFLDSKINADDDGSHEIKRCLLLGRMKVLVVQLCMTLCDPIIYACNSPGKNTGVGCHSLLQGIFPIQGSNLSLLHCRQILYHLNYQGSLKRIATTNLVK